MTDNDIIRMAWQEACKTTGWKPGLDNDHVVETAVLFAALVTAEIGIEQHRRGYKAGLRDGAAAEREACLGLALAEIGEGDENLPYRVAAAIRARAQN